MDSYLFTGQQHIQSDLHLAIYHPFSQSARRGGPSGEASVIITNYDYQRHIVLSQGGGGVSMPVFGQEEERNHENEPFR